MTVPRIRRCGEAALLLDCDDLAHAVTLARTLQRRLPEAVDVVPAARTVLVTARDAAGISELRRRVEQVAGEVERSGEQDAADGRTRTHRLPVRYDGPDLAAVAELAGTGVGELVRRHTETTWRAAFGGFAPGFCYLVDDRELGGLNSDTARGVSAEPGAAVLPTVPRLDSPRARVPAGSVALADRFCAVYPGVSPGGWRLIGSTDAVLWDAARPDPALVIPGDVVRFVEAR